jgi:hypothetical protein
MPLPSQRLLTTWEITRNTSALCDAIPIMWQNTDVQILSLLAEPVTVDSTTSTSSGGLSSNFIATATGTIYNTDALSTSSRQSGIPNGAKIGIGVIIPVVMIALFKSIFIYFRRRNGQNNIQHEAHKGELDERLFEHFWKPELYSERRPAEMDANRETRELESAKVVHEMPDTSIPGISIRDTSIMFDPRERNYLTDIISQPLDIPGHIIANNNFIAETDDPERTSTVRDITSVGSAPTSRHISNASRHSFTLKTDNPDVVHPSGACSIPSISNNPTSKVNDIDRVSPISEPGRPSWPTRLANDEDIDVVSPISNTTHRGLFIFMRGLRSVSQ